MIKTIAILTTLVSVALAHWPVNPYVENTFVPGYGLTSFGDWNSRGYVSDVAGTHNYVNNGPWFVGSGGHRTGGWANSYHNGWNSPYGANRWNGWNAAGAPVAAAVADAAYDTYAPTYANSVYATNGFGNGYGHGYGYGNRFGRANNDFNTPYSRYY